jgi:hypothetical protein
VQKSGVKAAHKSSSWGDAIRVEWLSRNVFSAFSRLLHSVGKVTCRPKSAAALLIHFGSRGTSIDSHHENFLRPDQVENILYVTEYSKEHFSLR